MTPPQVEERDDFGRRLLEPVVYTPVLRCSRCLVLEDAAPAKCEGFADGHRFARIGFALPAEEQALVAELTRIRENGLGVYGRSSSSAEPASDPFACPVCGGPVGAGWTFCSRRCRLEHNANRRP